MILYLDTSSLVKLYIDEVGSQTVRSLVDRATVVSTSVIAYPEARSAFARLHREGALEEEELIQIKSALERDWPSYLTLDMTEKIWRHAGELTESYALRGFDSLHLASYLALANLHLSHSIEFSAYDLRLDEAARRATGARS